MRATNSWSKPSFSSNASSVSRTCWRMQTWCSHISTVYINAIGTGHFQCINNHDSPNILTKLLLPRTAIAFLKFFYNRLFISVEEKNLEWDERAEGNWTVCGTGSSSRRQWATPQRENGLKVAIISRSLEKELIHPIRDGHWGTEAVFMFPQVAALFSMTD